MNQSMIKYLQFDVSGDIFECLERYDLKQLVGKGAYGKVCSAHDQVTGREVAIKKIASTFRNAADARRTLTEIRILRCLGEHENIISLIDLFPPPNLPKFDDLYAVYDLMQTDLHQVLKSPQRISSEQMCYIMYQVFRGLKYIHAAGIIHRDLKPSNLLLSSDCDIKICDFGLSTWNGSQTYTPEYVVTRWYRAPELLLSCSDYDYAIDIWSAGCIFAEILGRRPLFPGSDWLHTMTLIFRVIGTPSPPTIHSIASSDASRAYLQSVPQQAGIPFSKLFPDAGPEAIDLLTKLLDFDPSKRPTASQALRHPYFQALHEPCDEPILGHLGEGETNLVDQLQLENATIPELRREVFREISKYHPEL
jgi:serine/threonine protein kinase